MACIVILHERRAAVKEPPINRFRTPTIVPMLRNLLIADAGTAGERLVATSFKRDQHDDG